MKTTSYILYKKKKLKCNLNFLCNLHFISKLFLGEQFNNNNKEKEDSSLFFLLNKKGEVNEILKIIYRYNANNRIIFFLSCSVARPRY